jgi:AcrR family transcriptional regulator
MERTLRLPSPKRAGHVDEPGRSARKRTAILRAATEVFLKGGYLGTNVDEIAAGSGVSKQTVYKHFGSKEALFIEIVASMTTDAGDLVLRETPEPDPGADLAGYLRTFADKQLTVVLTPRLLQLRRLVIGEVSRFPDLARVLYERGPQRALTRLTAVFERLAARGLLTIDDPAVAASHFNWLIMADPLNRAMLLGDEAIPAAAALRRHIAEGVRVFLAAYAPRQSHTRQVKTVRRSRRRDH